MLACMPWNPQQYLKFAGQRLRPGFDLLAQVGLLPPGPLFDLGCGTGVHTAAIAERWPERQVAGLDKSPDMLAEAARAAPGIAWREADIAQWSAPEKAALIFSSATLHWLTGHDRLFPHLVRQLAADGVLAVQMPRNFANPSQVLLRETAAEGKWAARLRPLFDPASEIPSLLRPDPVAAPEFYYDLLAPLAKGGFDLWETEYFHLLEGEDAVLEWMHGTALRPVVEALADGEREAFLATYAARLRAAFPRRRDGKTLLTFRRLFFVARL
jgi:trans-aconitate 2-methyltransferase